MATDADRPLPARPARAGKIPRVVGDPVVDPAQETLRLYARDWDHFVAWCRQSRRAALPATAETVAAYLAVIAPDLSRGTLGRRRAAIRSMHRRNGLPIPQLDRTALAGLRTVARTAAPAKRTSWPSAASLAQLAAGCARDLAGLRDRAMLLLAAADLRPLQTDEPAAERVGRRILLGLDQEHIRFVADGAILRLRERPDDAEPRRTVLLPRSLPGRCPVMALEDWLNTSGTQFGPVFRKVDRWGNLEHARLGHDIWRHILARRKAPLRRPGARVKAKG